jgi:hypothetical protein
MDKSHRITDNSWPKAGLLVHVEVPRSPDLRIAIDVTPLTYASTKTAKQKTPPGVKKRRCWSKHKHPNNLPSKTGK